MEKSIENANPKINASLKSARLIDTLKNTNDLLLALSLSPLISLFLNIFNLSKTLYFSKILLKGSWKNFLAYDPANSCLRTFYLIQINNIERYGLKGFSPTIGNGLPLSMFWYHSITSLLAYKAAGMVSIIAALLFWLLSFYIWSETVAELSWCSIIIFLTFISSNFCGNLFARQNYNALGWAMLPLIIWSLLTKNLFILITLMAISSFFSITVLTSACFILFIYCLLSQNYIYFYAIVFPILKFSFDIYYYLYYNSISGAHQLKTILRFIGASRKSEYIRPIKIFYPLCFSFILSIFPLIIFYREISFLDLDYIKVSLFAASPVALFFLNQTGIFRFADVQSMLMLFLTVSTTITILSQDWAVVLIFWLVNSNGIISYILYFNTAPVKNIISSIPALRPFDFSTIKEPITNFLMDIPTGSNVYIANHNPCGNYNSIFDGYANHYQALFHCADLLNISITPDWYSVMFKSTPYYWGRNPEDVKVHMEKLNSIYCILYLTDEDHLLLDEFFRKGFCKINILDWKNITEDFFDDNFKKISENLTWILLKK